MQKNSVFITGASSLMGQLIASKLQKDYDLTYLINKTSIPIKGENINTIEGGLWGLDQHPEVVQNADIVLHLAGLTHTNDQDEYFKVNLEGTRQLLKLCRKDQPFIYMSTRCVSEEGGGYSHSKLLAEKAILESGVPYTIIRPAEVYGSKAGEGMDSLISLAARYRVLIDFKWPEKITYSPISVEELALFTVDVINQGGRTNEIYTLSNNSPYNASDIKNALEKGLGKKIIRIPVPVKLLQLLNAMHLPMPFKRDQLLRLIMPKSNDNQLARDQFNFSPISFLEYLENFGVFAKF